MENVYDINTLEVGDYVNDCINGGYARVTRCIHGNLYYAFCGDENIDTDVDAYDTDEDYINCCG